MRVHLSSKYVTHEHGIMQCWLVVRWIAASTPELASTCTACTCSVWQCHSCSVGWWVTRTCMNKWGTNGTAHSHTSTCSHTGCQSHNSTYHIGGGTSTYLRRAPPNPPPPPHLHHTHNDNSFDLIKNNCTIPKHFFNFKQDLQMTLLNNLQTMLHLHPISLCH